MTEAQIAAALTDRQALACTLLAEAGGDAGDGSSLEERAAVGCVIRNRVRNPGWWGNSYRDVCLRPAMFSCWSPGNDPNHLRIIQAAYLLVTGQPTLQPLLDECLWLADGVIAGTVLDRTGGCDHYFAPKAMVPKGSVPKWAKKKDGTTIQPGAIIGSQWFYRLRK